MCSICNMTTVGSSQGYPVQGIRPAAPYVWSGQDVICMVCSAETFLWLTYLPFVKHKEGVIVSLDCGQGLDSLVIPL